MKRENLKRANEIDHRLEELELQIKILEAPTVEIKFSAEHRIFYFDSNKRNGEYLVSDMKNYIISEIDKLQEELETL